MYKKLAWPLAPLPLILSLSKDEPVEERAAIAGRRRYANRFSTAYETSPTPAANISADSTANARARRT